MKNFLLYLFFFTYSASILKPCVPYLSDIISHTFYYAEHVKTVHFENGKYHVHHELVKMAQKNTGDENGGYLKKISLPDEHLIVTNNFSFLNPYFPHPYLLPVLQSITAGCTNAVFSPPRC
jgi:hypothetical protein